MKYLKAYTVEVVKIATPHIEVHACSKASARRKALKRLGEVVVTKETEGHFDQEVIKRFIGTEFE